MTQHLPLFLLCGNSKLANFSMGSLELAVSPVFLGKEKVIFFLVAFLSLLLSPPECICILRGDHFFPVLVPAVWLDFLLFCCIQSSLPELTSFGEPSPLQPSPTTVGFGFSPSSLTSAGTGGAGSGGRAKGQSPLRAASELQQREGAAPAKHPKAADISSV